MHVSAHVQHYNDVIVLRGITCTWTVCHAGGIPYTCRCVMTMECCMCMGMIDWLYPQSLALASSVIDTLFVLPHPLIQHMA